VGDWNPPVSVFEFEELGFKSSGLHTGERAHLYIAMGTLRQAARLARGRTRRR
jgi:hypothetical protein